MTDAGLTQSVAGAATSTDTGNTAPVVDNTQQQNSEPGTGINPAWKELMDVLPTQLHSLVTPHLTKWDQSAQQRVTEANQKYEPWNPLVENGYDPTMVQGLLQLIENDPQKLIDSLVEFHGLTPKEAAQVVGGQNPADVLDLDAIQPPQEFDIEQHPQFQQMKQQQEQMAQWVQQQAQKEIQDRANAEIDQELKALEAKHGAFDQKALFAFAQTIPNLTSLEQAYDAMNSYNQSILQNRPSNFAPPVLAPTGGAPAGQQVDVAKLKPQDRKHLVADILARAHQEG